MYVLVVEGGIAYVYAGVCPDRCKGGLSDIVAVVEFCTAASVIMEGLETVRGCCCAVHGEDDAEGSGLLLAGWRVGKDGASRFARLLLAGCRVGKDDKVVSGVIGRDAGLGWMLVEDQEKAGTWVEGLETV